MTVSVNASLKLDVSKAKKDIENLLRGDSINVSVNASNFSVIEKKLKNFKQTIEKDVSTNSDLKITRKEIRDLFFVITSPIKAIKKTLDTVVKTSIDTLSESVLGDTNLSLSSRSSRQKSSRAVVESQSTKITNVIDVNPVVDSVQSLQSLVDTRLQAIEDGLRENDISVETKSASGGIFSTLTSPLTNVFEGAFEGIGRDFIKGSGSTIAKGLESEISPLIGSFENIGSTIGRELGQGVILSLEGNLDSTQQLFKNILGGEIVNIESANVRFLEAEKAAQKYNQALNQIGYEADLIRNNPDFIEGQKQSLQAFSVVVQRAALDVEKLVQQGLSDANIEFFENNLKSTQEQLRSSRKELDELTIGLGELKELLASGDTSATDLLLIPSEIKDVENSINQVTRQIDLLRVKEKEQEQTIKNISSIVEKRYQEEITNSRILQGELEKLEFQLKQILSVESDLESLRSNVPQSSLLISAQARSNEALTSDIADSVLERIITRQLEGIEQEADKMRESAKQKLDNETKKIEDFLVSNDLPPEKIEKINQLRSDIQSNYVVALEEIETQLSENLQAVKEGLQVFKPNQNKLRETEDSRFVRTTSYKDSAQIAEQISPHQLLPEVEKSNLKETTQKALEEESSETSRAILIFNKLIEETIKASGVNTEDIKGSLPTLNKPKSLLEELKGVGEAGSFDHKQNAVNVSRAIYQRLEEGMLKPSDVGLIIHELRHGLQRGFSGSPTNTALSELMKIEDIENISSSDANKLRNRVAFSSSTTTDPQIKQYKLKVEEDAYSFETQYQDEVYNNIKEFMRGLNENILVLGQDPGIENLRKETQELLSQDDAEQYIGGSTFSRKGLAKVAKDIGIDKDIVTKGKKSDLVKAIIERSKSNLEQVSQTIAEYGDSIRNKKFKTGVKGIRGGTNNASNEIKEIQQAVKFLYKELNNIPSQITEDSYGQIYGFLSKIKTVGDALEKIASQTDLSSDFNKQKAGYVSSLKTLITRFSAKTQEDLGSGFNEVLKNLDNLSLDFEKQVSDVVNGEFDFGSEDIFEKLDTNLDGIDQGFSDIFDFIKKAFGQGSNNLTDFGDDINQRIQEIETEINRLDNYVEDRKSQAPKGRFRPDFSINTESPEQKFVEAQTNIEGLLDQFNTTADKIEQRAIAAEIGVNEALGGIGSDEDNIVNRIKRIFNAFTGSDDGSSGGGNKFEDIANGFKLIGGALAGIFIADLLELDSLIEKIAELYGEVLEAAIAFESLQTSITFTSGSAEKGANGLAFVTAEAERLKVAVESAAEGYQQLSASAQGNEELQAIANQTTSAILQSSRALNLDVETQGRAIVALSQIASKGVVSQEELRGQLSEAIPNALQIASRAFALTTKELNELIASGLDATTFLTLFSRQLDQETYYGAIQAANTLGASFQNLQNQAFLTKQSLGKEIADSARLGMEALATVLGLVNNNAELIGLTLKAGVFIGAIGLFKLTQLAIPFIIKGITQINSSLGITTLLTSDLNRQTRSLTPTFDRLGIKVQSLGKGLIGIDNALGRIFKTPLKPGNFLERVQFTLQNIPKTLGNINRGFGSAVNGIQSFALSGVRAVQGLLRGIGAIATAIGPMIATFVAFDAAINIAQTVAKARNEMRKYRKELAKVDQAVQSALVKTEKDVSAASEARKKAFLEEQNIYIKGLNAISNVRKIFGGRNINEALIDQRVQFDNEKIFEASQALIESQNLLNAAQEGDVSGKALEAQLKALQLRKDALNQIIPLEVGQQKRRDNEIKAIDKTISQLQKEANAALGLSDAYGEIGKARLASIVAAKDAETQAIASLDEQIRQDVLTVEQGEFEKLKAKQERLDKQIAAEKLFLNSLDSKSEVEDRKKIEEQINKLVKEGYEVRSQIRQQETEEINNLSNEVIGKATIAEQQRVIEILKLEEKGVIGKEQAEKLKGEATIERIKLELKAEEEKLKAIAELNGKDSEEYQQQQQVRNSKVIELLNSEISAQNSLSNAISDTADAVEDSTNKNLENRKRELDVIGSQLDLVSQVQDKVRELEEARFNFSQVTSQGDTSLGELRIEQLRRALEIRRQLISEDADNLSAEQRRLLQEELASLGVSGRQGEKSILEEIAKIERENGQRKLELLQKEFEFKEKVLALDIKRAEIESRQQLLEARKAVLDAENRVDESESQEERNLALEELKIARQQLELAQDNQRALKEINNLKEQQLETEKAIALQTEKANQSSQSFETRNEIAEANRDEIAILKEEEKQRIKEARDKARYDKEAKENLDDTIKQIREETQQGIDRIRDERRRGNNIVTPVVSPQPIAVPISNIPVYRPSVSQANNLRPDPAIDLKGIRKDLNTLINTVREMGRPDVNTTINVPERDNSDLIRTLGNRIDDVFKVNFNYGT